VVGKTKSSFSGSFASDFKLSTSKSARLPRPSMFPSMIQNSNKTGSFTTINNITLAENLTKRYQEPNEDGQKNLWSCFE